MNSVVHSEQLRKVLINRLAGGLRPGSPKADFEINLITMKYKGEGGAPNNAITLEKMN